MKRLVVALLAVWAFISGCRLLWGFFSAQTTTGGVGSGEVSQGSPATDYASLVDGLRAAGASVEPSGEVFQDFFSVTGQVIRVNGEDVQVFEYADSAAANAEAALISPDAGSIGTSMMMWVATPHVYKAGRLIVLYIGDAETITDLLGSVLGPQFAGG